MWHFFNPVHLQNAMLIVPRNSDSLKTKEKVDGSCQIAYSCSRSSSRHRRASHRRRVRGRRLRGRGSSLDSPSHPNAAGTFSDADFVLGSGAAQSASTARRRALALAAFTWTCHTSHTAVIRRPRCHSQPCGGWWGSEVLTRSIANPSRLGALACGSEVCGAVDVGLAAIPPSAQSTFKSSNTLAKSFVLGLDDLHLSAVGGCVGVVLHGSSDVGRLSGRRKLLEVGCGRCAGLCVNRSHGGCRRVAGYGWTVRESIEGIAAHARNLHGLTSWCRGA